MPNSNPFDDPQNASSGLVAKGRPGGNSQELTITEISQALKRTVEDRFGYVKLRGELSGVKRAASGHFYCTLKDEKSAIDGVMWKGVAGRLSFQPEDGLEIVASGKITTYPGRSKYQIVIEKMEIAGEGALLALLEKTRKRLEAEGLFDERRKRALPFVPQVIGVVTSPTGSVIRDILHRLADRFPSHVLVWPVLVQGKGAAEQIAAAVRGFGAMESGGPIAKPDLVIVARGGGSIEDLWCFNEEVVVRAIAECSIPVISAVGHETDTTLADFAADRRAPTPSAAAEMAVPVLRDLAANLDEMALRQRRSVMRPVDLGRERLEARFSRMPRAQNIAQPFAQKLDDQAERLRRGLQDRTVRGRHLLQADKVRLSSALLQSRLDRASDRLGAIRLAPNLVERKISDGRRNLASLARLAGGLHPERPLSRGYAMVLDESGKALTSSDKAGKEALLDIKFADGIVRTVPHGALGDAPLRQALPRKPAKRTKKADPNAESAQPKLL